MRRGQINPAWTERESFLGLLKAPGLLPSVYMIVCWQDAAILSAQEMTEFTHNFVFSGGELNEHDDRWWLEARSRVRKTQALGPQGGF